MKRPNKLDMMLIADAAFDPIEAIIERLEAGEGPDRELDLSILCWKRGKVYRWAEFGGLPGLADNREIAVEVWPDWMRLIRPLDDLDIGRVPAYTGSLDAAITLFDIVPARIDTNARRVTYEALCRVSSLARKSEFQG